jgi:hypothetical protein
MKPQKTLETIGNHLWGMGPGMQIPADQLHHYQQSYVQAVDSYGDLLAALKSAYSILSQPVQFTDSAGAAPASILRGDAEVARKVISAALAKAQGEGGAE